MKTSLHSTPTRPALRRAVHLLLLALAFLVGLGGARAATANPPDLMTCQGYLADGTGVPLGNAAPANYNVVFRIWPADTGGAAGTALWTELQTVTVDKGNFSVVLGQGLAFPAEAAAHGSLSAVFAGPGVSDRFLEMTVTIGGSPLTIAPRMRLLPAPYSFLAANALNANTATAALAVSSTNVITVDNLSTNVATWISTNFSNSPGSWSASGTNIFRTNGFVGIHTTTPRYPLEVGATVAGQVGNSGFNSYVLSGGLGVYGNNNPNTGSSAFYPWGNHNISIYAPYWIWAGHGFVQPSDRRIKDIVGLADTQKDLATLMRLTVTDYRKKDRVAHGDRLLKGLIAQEVQAIIPEAVMRNTQFVPSIYAKAETLNFDKKSQTLRVQMAKAHELKKGDHVRLITNEAQPEKEVLAVLDAQTFVVGSVTEDPKLLFVYGKQVDDFLAVDYDRIFTTGISAIQELAKQKEAQAAEITALRTELARLRAEKKVLAETVIELDARDQARETRLNRLEAALEAMSSTAKVKAQAPAKVGEPTSSNR